MEFRPPYHDVVGGSLLRIGEEQALNVLIIGESSRQLPGEQLYSGEMYLRYGLVYLYKETDALIPQYALDDFRREYHAADALDFLYEKGERFPRADVVGIRVPDGTKTQAYAKELDHARPYRMIACKAHDNYQRISQVHIAVTFDREVDDWVIKQGKDNPSIYYGRSTLTIVAHPTKVDKLEMLVAQWIGDIPAIME